jgi:predicted nucleic acid-binding protein
MIAVADTSPVNYLVLVDEIDLLPAIFGNVLIPEAVMEELHHPRTPLKVRNGLLIFRVGWNCDPRYRLRTPPSWD